ncbi:hypothetical protein Barb7_00595 [Bacteroidales bacterium Barb7]|nr:hypothetical protein Barb7_00595 [Bacteroidales bacterium Barb7]
MEEKKAKERKWYIYDENGKRKELIYPKPERLSPLGLWREEHPGESIVNYWAAMENK